MNNEQAQETAATPITTYEADRLDHYWNGRRMVYESTSAIIETTLTQAHQRVADVETAKNAMAAELAQAQADRDKALGELRGAREVIQTLLDSAHPNEPNHPAMCKAWKIAKTFLSKQPENLGEVEG